MPYSLTDVFRDGFMVALLNPKTTPFFAAFLPQFMSSAAPFGRSICLSVLFVSIAMLTDAADALGAGAIAPALQRTARSSSLARYLTSSLYVALGLAAACGTRPAPQ